MDVTILLADHAQVSDGKVSALGLGWQVTVTPTPPMALVMLVDVDWTPTRSAHVLQVDLVDADGHPVPFFGSITSTFEVEGSDQALPGADFRVPFALNLPPGMPLAAGQRYQWRATLDGQHDPGWVATFQARTLPA